MFWFSWFVRRLLRFTKIFLTKVASLFNIDGVLIGTYWYWLHPHRKSGFNGPLNGQAGRAKIVDDLLATMEIDSIIETGTYFGTTTDYFSSLQDLPVYTVELNPKFYWFCWWRFRATRNVHLYLDDARSFLAKCLGSTFQSKGLKKPFCYLDAHWNEDLPLFEEIEMIRRFRPSAIVLVDDFAVPDDQGYGFDSYGVQKTLDLKTLRSHVQGSYATYFPAIHAVDETGHRRGCVIIAFDPANISILDTNPLLRRIDNIKDCRPFVA